MEETMREFNYEKLAIQKWDMETISFIAQINEHKGRQELYLRQKPVELDRLIDLAKIQSTEASNKIEGIVTTETRIKQLVQEKTTPRNRDEKEIAGYRDVLNTVHESHAYIPLTPNYIKQLHRDLMQYTDVRMGGQFKNTQNYIAENHSDGTVKVLFTPVAPFETEVYVQHACDAFRIARDKQIVDPLILIPAFLLDFLCIHPFNDGNGRMSRLLTLLLLYQSGFEVGKYISVEKHIEKTKEVYYRALWDSDQRWYEGENDPTPFIKYMLGVIIACYRDFEERLSFIGDKSSAYDIVSAALNIVIGKFSKSDIMNLCPTLSKSSVEGVLRKLIEEGKIQRFGGGRSVYYLKSDAIMTKLS